MMQHVGATFARRALPPRRCAETRIEGDEHFERFTKRCPEEIHRARVVAGIVLEDGPFFEVELRCVYDNP